MAEPVLPQWDNTQTNMARPSETLFNEGYALEAIPTSANMNYLLHNITSNIIPVGIIMPIIAAQVDIPEGFLYCGGATIGSDASAAALKSDNYEQLFIFLWDNWPQAVVTPSKGVSAQADWDDNKSITLPDMREKTLIGYKSGGSFAPTLGASIGENEVTLTVNQIPPHTHSIELPYKDLGYDPSGGYDFYGPTDNTATINTSSIGGGQAHNNIQQSFVCNWMIKW